MLKENSYIPAVERGATSHTNIEHYKEKRNGAERHAEDALRICLAALTKIKEYDLKGYIEDLEVHAKLARSSNPRLDPLNIKRFVKSGVLPSIEQFNSLPEFSDALSHIDDDSIYENMNPDVLDSIRAQDEAWETYVASIKQKSYEGGPLIVSGSQNVLLTRESIGAKFVARFNIKTPITISPYEVVQALAKIFEENKTILKNGFQLKSLSGNSWDRDSVIVYSTEGSFSEIAKILDEYFKDNYQYHDRNADKAIFGGVALESSDGSKFPAIRICAEPDSISNKLSSNWTFNDLQSTIIGRVLGYFVATHFNGSKEAMLEYFAADYLAGLSLWEDEFPVVYEKSAKDLLGEEIELNNIAFFS
jgi:hypothetical protein